jgi:hypothetical protein
MSRVPARRSTRKRTKIVHRYLVGPVDAPQFYVEDYVSARLFLVYVPDDYSARLPGLERFTLGRRLFEEIPAYKSLRADRRGAVVAATEIAPRSANVLHVPSLDIEIRGGRVIRLGS